MLASWNCAVLKDAEPLFVGEAAGAGAGAVGEDTNVN